MNLADEDIAQGLATEEDKLRAGEAWQKRMDEIKEKDAAKPDYEKAAEDEVEVLLRDAGHEYDSRLSWEENVRQNALNPEVLIQEIKQKFGRGGARPGAGRKKGSVKEGATGRKKVFKTMSISGTPEEIAKLKTNAAAADQTVSRFVISRLAN